MTDYKYYFIDIHKLSDSGDDETIASMLSDEEKSIYQTTLTTTT